SVNLGFGYFLNDSTLLEINAQPGVYSDFSGTLHHGDWQMYGNALVTWQYDRNIYVRAGAEYSGLFRDIEAYPLLGVGLAIQNNFRFDLLAPRSARLTADLSQDSSLNLSLDLAGNEYQIRPRQPSNHQTVHVQELELSLGGYHRFNKAVSLHARVGTTLLGDYKWRNTTAVYRGTLEPQMFAEVGFGWTF
ncbi:MAG: DUF6268 family outer membrane beta-barrel protein, partial [Planctomycetota bacterium]|nr:DUF6268 family outer membrane beta-barrel protein [Planctomycetota bacterium]